MTQAFNSLGTAIAPWFGGMLILATVPKAAAQIAPMLPAELQQYRIEQASSVKIPYIGIAVALALLAIVIGLFKLPRIPSAEGGHAVVKDDSIWKHPNLVMGAIGIFTYVGAEVAIGSFLINYLHEPNIGDLTLETAAKVLSIYWLGAMVGRFIGSVVLRYLPPRRVLAANAFIAAALVCLSMASTGHVAIGRLRCEDRHGPASPSSVPRGHAVPVVPSVWVVRAWRSCLLEPCKTAASHSLFRIWRNGLPASARKSARETLHSTSTDLQWPFHAMTSGTSPVAQYCSAELCRTLAAAQPFHSPGDELRVFGFVAGSLRHVSVVARKAQRGE